MEFCKTTLIGRVTAKPVSSLDENQSGFDSYAKSISVSGYLICFNLYRVRCMRAGMNHEERNNGTIYQGIHPEQVISILDYAKGFGHAETVTV